MGRRKYPGEIRTRAVGADDQSVALPITDGLRFVERMASESPDVAHRRLAEEAVEFAAKLTTAFVLDLKRGTCSIRVKDCCTKPLARQDGLRAQSLRRCSSGPPRAVEDGGT